MADEMTLEERVARLERKTGLAHRYYVGTSHPGFMLCAFGNALCFKHRTVDARPIYFTDKEAGEAFVEVLREFGVQSVRLVREDA